MTAIREIGCVALVVADVVGPHGDAGLDRDVTFSPYVTGVVLA
ncbi:MAG: hypothetical protein R2849_11245 [Thermomicrobiales bacterium]